jgi:hypothetical protein
VDIISEGVRIVGGHYLSHLSSMTGDSSNFIQLLIAKELRIYHLDMQQRIVLGPQIQFEMCAMGAFLRGHYVQIQISTSQHH